MQHESRKTIPVTVLTGLSGAGKTTVLQHILQSLEPGLRFAVIENGNGIDVDREIVNVASCERIARINHCVSCTIRNDLVEALQELEQSTVSVAGVMIETTSVADPAPIAQIFFDERIHRRYHLDGFVTVVDTRKIMMQVKEKADWAKNVPAEQIAFADRLVLSKCDLVVEEQIIAVEKALKCVNAYAAFVRSEMGCLEPSNIFNIRATDICRVPVMKPECLVTGSDHYLNTSVSSVHIHLVGELNVHKLQFWINGLMKSKAEDLLRYKGLLALKDTKSKCIFQGVHANYSCSLEDDYEWHENESRECHLVLIGYDLDQAELEKGIMECKVGTLRFQLGDCVRVNVDGERWRNGIISKLWDEGFPYLIDVELQGDSWGCPLKCWAPIDDDQYVKENDGACKVPWNAAYSEAVAHGTTTLCQA